MPARNDGENKPLAPDDRVAAGLPMTNLRRVELPPPPPSRPVFGGGGGGGGGPTDEIDALDATDIRNGERFAEMHHGRALFIAQWGKWVAWDGTRYQLDHANLRVTEFAKETVRMVEDPTWAKKSGARERLSAMVALAASEAGMSIQHERLDQEHMLLNLRNGTLDLRTGKIRAHDPKDLLTMIGGAKFDASARAPRWQRFLEEITDGGVEVQKYLQRFAGYCLTGSVTEHMLLFAFGDGRNGKGTFLRRLMGILGEYAIPARQELLMATHGEQHPTIRASLFRKRLVAISEIDQGRRWAEADLKEMTGGDKLSARRMREDDWSFDPTHKFFVSGNHKPDIRGNDNGVWSRIKLVGFPVNFEERGTLDRTLDATLDEETSGILNWAIEGCLEWQSKGLAEPAAVTDAVKTYREEEDALGEFFAEYCEFGSPDLPRYRAKRGTIRKAYQAWCEETGAKPWTPRVFWRAVRERKEIEEASSVRELAGGNPDRGFKGVHVLTELERGDRGEDQSDPQRF